MMNDLEKNIPNGLSLYTLALSNVLAVPGNRWRLDAASAHCIREFYRSHTGSAGFTL